MSDRIRGKLMDRRQISDEFGLTRAAAEALMRQLPKVTIDGLRKVYVRRVDADEYLAKNTTEAA